MKHETLDYIWNNLTKEQKLKMNKAYKEGFEEGIEYAQAILQNMPARKDGNEENKM